MRRLEEVLRAQHEQRMSQRGSALPKEPSGAKAGGLSPELRSEIYQLTNQGFHGRAIAARLGIHQTTVSRVLRGTGEESQPSPQQPWSLR